ncbi:hypothetical protein Afil01_42830 [Actinorhabdospora filicis]|uniref:Uncharacterized protein n=1 Tax=Actinorhabdospora filicis TaxID=1785913 RepID=A0A9W6WBE1_9ACTN|nr:hypothetical protein Afil01_42830 [Actinorhabdospora filicis]
MLGDLGVECGRHVAVGEVGAARLGGDGEAGWHGEAYPGHFGQVGAFSTEKVALIFISFGEIEDEPLHLGLPMARPLRKRGVVVEASGTGR